MKYIASLIPLVAFAGSAIGIGNIFAAFLLAYSSNPLYKQDYFQYLILGFAFCESLALFSLNVIFIYLIQIICSLFQS